MRLNEAALAALEPQERAQAEEQLRRLKGYLDENPLLSYEPHGKQREFHAAHTRIKAFFGGNRSGKTTASIADNLIQAVDREALPNHLKQYKVWEPPFYCRIVAPKFNENHEGVIFPKIRELVPRGQLLGKSWEKAFSKQRRMLFFKNGSWFQFLTFEQDLDAFSGAALHRVHFDEEPPGDKGLQIWRENRARLIDFKGDAVFSLTPLFGLSWVYRVVWEPRHEDHISVIQVAMDDNPHLDADERDAYLKDLTKEEREARRYGKFIHLHGRFYEEFTDELHTCEPKPPEHLREQAIVVGIDPGLRKTGVVWIAFDSDNAAYVFDEFYPGEALPPQVAAEIKRRNAFWGVDPVYVIDPSARNRATVNAEAVEAEYAREGIYAQHGQNDRAAGILEVKRRLQHGTLVVSRACRNLIWEFGMYRKDNTSPDEFAAIKEDDHLLDALRYACMARVWYAPTPQRTKRSNYNPDPRHVAPWRGERPSSNPPLGVLS